MTSQLPRVEKITYRCARSGWTMSFTCPACSHRSTLAAVTDPKNVTCKQCGEICDTTNAEIILISQSKTKNITARRN